MKFGRAMRGQSAKIILNDMTFQETSRNSQTNPMFGYLNNIIKICTHVGIFIIMYHTNNNSLLD